MRLDLEPNYNIEELLQVIKSCEGKHIQQVVFSTYHKALTQICFDCQKVRTMLTEADLQGDKNDCDCKMFIGGSGELCPKCKQGDKT